MNKCEIGKIDTVDKQVYIDVEKTFFKKVQKPMKEKINSYYYLKNMKFCIKRDTINTVSKIKAIKWEKIFVTYIIEVNRI